MKSKKITVLDRIKKFFYIGTARTYTLPKTNTNTPMPYVRKAKKNSSNNNIVLNVSITNHGMRNYDYVVVAVSDTHVKLTLGNEELYCIRGR